MESLSRNVWMLSWKRRVPRRKMSFIPWVCRRVQSPDTLKKAGVIYMPTCSRRQRNFAFFHGVNATFEMWEELAALQSLKGTTTGEDIFSKVCQTMEQLDLDWSKLASIMNDGAPSREGASRGLIRCMNREVEEHSLSVPRQVHCLIHQQALCCKVFEVGFCYEGCGFMHKLP